MDLQPCCANGDGPVLGREQEIADLLRFMKNNGIRNTVWLTADVHYAAAHHYDPNRAQWDPGLQASAFPLAPGIPSTAKAACRCGRS
jgi:alkaline phosphatase D